MKNKKQPKVAIDAETLAAAVNYALRYEDWQTRLDLAWWKGDVGSIGTILYCARNLYGEALFAEVKKILETMEV